MSPPGTTYFVQQQSISCTGRYRLFVRGEYVGTAVRKQDGNVEVYMADPGYAMHEKAIKLYIQFIND